MADPDRTYRPPDSLTLRDLLYPLVRYRLAALLAFGSVLGATLIAFAILKPEYEATMKVLVKRERMDPVMSPTANAPSQAAPDVTEDELNSEVELMKSRDLLGDVAVASGLVSSSPETAAAGPTVQPELSRAISALQRKLDIGAIRKTTLIA